MASGAFYSRTEHKNTALCYGQDGTPLVLGDRVIPYTGDGSNLGTIVKIEDIERHTAGSCVVKGECFVDVKEDATGEIKTAFPYHLLYVTPKHTDPPNHDADSFIQVVKYYRRREHESKKHGWEWDRRPRLAQGEPWGVIARFSKGSEDRYSIYVLKSYRELGRATEYIDSRPDMKFISLNDCKVAEFYRNRGRDCIIL